MFLKRLYQREEDGSLTRPLVVRNVIRVKTAAEFQKFSPRIINTAVIEGWMTLGKGLLTIHGEEGDVVYKVLRIPGYYCCFCGGKLDGEVKSRAHVLELHKDAKKPNTRASRNNPAGYELAAYFSCAREE